MNQPIPRGGTEPLQVGDRVQIVPEWQDPGDDRFERYVIEAPANTTKVRIRTIIPGLVFHPTEWIEADHLISIPTIEPQATTPCPPSTSHPTHSAMPRSSSAD